MAEHDDNRPWQETRHGECDCVPDLGPSHCHLCGDAAGHPVTWADPPCEHDDNLDALIAEGLGFTGNGVTDRLVAALVSVRAELDAERAKNTEALANIERTLDGTPNVEVSLFAFAQRRILGGKD